MYIQQTNLRLRKNITQLNITVIEIKHNPFIETNNLLFFLHNHKCNLIFDLMSFLIHLLCPFKLLTNDYGRVSNRWMPSQHVFIPTNDFQRGLPLVFFVLPNPDKDKTCLI